MLKLRTTLSHMYRELSQGERGLLGLAIALVTSAELLWTLLILVLAYGILMNQPTH
jgi:ABC-type branched-subunit amino acid transport system ATPase component